MEYILAFDHQWSSLIPTARSRGDASSLNRAEDAIRKPTMTHKMNRWLWPHPCGWAIPFLAILGWAGMALILGATSAHAQEPLGAVIKLSAVPGNGNWAVPATIEMVVTRPGQNVFAGSNGKPERGTPFFSREVEAGAVFYPCDTVTGFPASIGPNRPPINRRGGSSFIATKTAADGTRKLWINASVGAYRVVTAGDRLIISEWEYQVRYFSGDPKAGLPESLVIGTVPNSDEFGGNSAIASEVNLRMPELPDIAGDIGERLVFPSGFGPGDVGTVAVLVTNMGVAKASGPISVGFYLSADAQLDRFFDMPLSLLTVQDIDLEPGTSRVLISDPLKLPTFLPADGFYFLAQLDTAGTLAESNELNNVAVSVAPGPDLFVSSWNAVFPNGYIPGALGRLDLTIQNRGFGAARGTVETAAYLSVDRTLSSDDWKLEPPRTDVLDLPPGRQIALAWNDVRVPTNTPPGQYMLLLSTDDGGILREQVETNNVLDAIQVQVPGNDLGGSVRMITNSLELLHMPGDRRTASISITNQGTDPIQTTIAVELFLSADKVLDTGRDLLLYERLDQPVRLSRGESMTLDIPVQLIAGTNPPLDRSGPRHFIFRLNGDERFHETFRINNEVASEEFLMGYHVLSVATHGFNPTPPPLGNWQEFRTNWYRIGNELLLQSHPNSFLYGRTKSLVLEWESSSGFLGAFAALFAAKICDAAATNAIFEKRPDDEAHLRIKSSMLKTSAARMAADSSKLAVGAAYQALGHLRSGGYLLNDPAESRGFQKLLLVGHSRGAAVNARLTQLLDALGYRVDEYIALDGFSTDWPEDGGLIGDLDLAAEAKSAQRRVSYRVQRGLVDYVLDTAKLNDPTRIYIYDTVVDALQLIGRVGKLANNPLLALLKGLDVLPEGGTLLELKAFDIRAPNRNGFENVILPGDGTGSTHVSITSDYLGNPQYFWDNYLGKNRTISRPPADSASDLAFSPEPISSGNMDLMADVRTPAGRGFIDGDFSESAALRTLALKESTVSSGNRFVDAWILVLSDARSVLATIWKIEGEVDLVNIEGDSMSELKQGPHTSLGQDLVLEAPGGVVRFDYQVFDAGPGDLLEIGWGSEVLATLPLQAAAQAQEVSINLGDRTGLGRFFIRLAGPNDAPSRLRVDDFVLSYPAPVLPRLGWVVAGNAGSGLKLEIEGAPSSVAMVESSSDLRSWADLQSVTVPAEGKAIVELAPNATATTRFYRLRLPSPGGSRTVRSADRLER